MIPHGLMTCYINTNLHTSLEVRILELSVLGFTFRLPIGESPFENNVRVVVHQLNENENRSTDITDAKITYDSDEQFWIQYRLETESAEFKKLIGTFMIEYGNYVRMKMCNDIDGIASSMCRNAPFPETYYNDIHTQREAWCVRLRLPRRWSEAKETAVILDNPDIISAYLRTPADPFLEEYKRIRGCDAECLNRLKINCLYIGNEYCLHLLPDLPTLTSVFEKAQREQLNAILCLPPVPDQAIDSTVETIKQLRARFLIREIVVNDWGMLSLLSDLKDPSPTITLGILLCKRHKDTRFENINGNHALPVQSSIDDPTFCKQLEKRFGKIRFSCESGFGAVPAASNTVMYWPTAQMNTAEYCGLRAICETGDRSNQKYEASCPRYCRDHFLFYPAQTDMLGKYNTIFGFSDREEFSSFERLVITLL